MNQNSGRYFADGQKKNAFDALYGVSPKQISQLRDICLAKDKQGLKSLLLSQHVADQADLLQQLDDQARQWVVTTLGASLDAEVFSHLDHAVREDVLENFETEELTEIIQDLDSDDAVDLIETLDAQDQQSLLAKMPAKARMLVETALAFPDDSAGRLMRREAAIVPAQWTVGQTIDHMRHPEIQLPDDFYNLIIIAPNLKPIGVVPLAKILRSSRDKIVQEIMDNDFKVIPAIMDQEDVAFLFRQYALVESPVVDQDGRLIGSITFDDVVEVIDAEHEDDILKMGGVREDDFYQDALRTTWSRSSWLFVNLITAILASLVIAVFEAAIDKVVALAILMPIVASMGGNAGTQTMTVAVRALATNELTPSNAVKILGKETLVGGVNGTIFAVLIGVLAWLWFGDFGLGGVIAIAMSANLLVAGMVGILVPLAMQYWGRDPAISSSIVLTTITDIVGFFSFLGLASLVLV